MTATSRENNNHWTVQQNVRSSARAGVGTTERIKQSCRSTRQQHAKPLGTAGRGKQSRRSTSQQHATQVVRPPVQYRETSTAVQTQLVSDGNRESVGYAEDERHSTNQLEQRVRPPHFHKNRSSIDLAEGSNQKGSSTRSVQRNPHGRADSARLQPPLYQYVCTND